LEAERIAREQAETLQAATKALTATLDLQEVFELILSELRRVVPYDSATVQQVQGGRLVIIGGDGFPNLEELLGVGFDPKAKDNPNRIVVHKRTPLILEDAPTLYEEFKREPHAQAGIRSWLGVPLLFGNQLLGMISLDKREPGFYTEEHAHLALAFAAQAAIAIENARLYEEAQQRLAELTLLFDTSASTSISLDVETVLQTTARQITTVLEIEGCTIYLWDQEQDALVSLVDYSPDLDWWKPEEPGTIFTLSEYPASRQILVERRPIVIQASDPQADPAELAWMADEQVQSVLMVPMIVRDQSIGTLEIMQSVGSGKREFTSTEVALCQTLANQAATALENARLFEGERQQRRIAETLREVASVLNTSLDHEQVLNLILEQLARVMDYDNVSVMLLSGQTLEMVAHRGFRLEDLDLGLIQVTKFPHLEEVLQTRHPRIIPDTRDDPRWQHRKTSQHIRCWLGAPLVAQDRVIGLLNLGKKEAGFYTQRDAELAVAFATQAAIAIENARLFEAEREQRELAEALRDAASAVSSTLDLEQILDHILEQVDRVIPSDAVNVNLIEDGQARMVRWRGYGRFGQEIQSVALSVVDTPSLRLMQETRQAIVIPDTEKEPGWVQVPEVAWLRSYAAAPICIQEQVIGFLNVDSATPGFFNEGHVDRLGAFADQASLAIQNARLYEEARRRNRELALFNRVIAASAASQNIRTILETVCRELALVFDVPQSAAALFNTQKTEAEVVVEYLTEGRPPSLGEIIPVEDNPSSQYMLEHKAPLVVNDAQTDPRLKPIQGLMSERGTVSLLILPLLVEGEVVGTLGVDAIEPRSFSPDDVDLAQRVADQVAGALARVRLEETQRRLSAAVEQAAEGVIITQPDGTIVYVNPAFERITGYELAQVTGFGPKALQSNGPGTPLYRQAWETVTSGEVWQGQYTDTRSDGSSYTVDSTVTPVRNQSGQIVNFVATMRDVTREVQLEEQFSQAQKMEALGRLAGGIAHDFNNLLTVINLSIRMLERQLHPEDPLWKYVRRIEETGQRAAKLTKQLLSFSRREIAEPQILNLNHIVEDLSRMLQRIIGETIELVTVLAKDLWPAKVDPSQMQQVIMNLVVNARDAMPQGGKLIIETSNVTLSEAYAASHVDARSGDHVLLAISDTGEGMSDEVKGHLFEPFFTTKERGQGTGLGLPIVFGIVKQSGGHIRVYSEVGQGTTFRIYLPSTHEAGAEGAVHPIPSSASKPFRGTETILVVEDKAEVRDLAAEVLESCGYQVLVAASGAEALAVSEQYVSTIHLLLTDLVMPYMNGQELAAQLQPLRPDMRVLFMSGYADAAITQNDVLAQGAAFLSKPFSVESLAQKVRAVLDDRA
jgi:PAS domain S-box-containing protein